MVHHVGQLLGLVETDRRVAGMDRNVAAGWRAQVDRAMLRAEADSLGYSQERGLVQVVGP